MTYTEIYQRYYDRIFKYCLTRLENNIMYAEDITSDVFLELFTKWDEIKQRPREAILSWLYKTAFNMISEHRRSKDRLIVSMDAENNRELLEMSLANQVCTIDVESESRRYTYYIKLLREQLSEEELKLFDNIVICHTPQTKLAQEMHISEKAVSMRWHRLKNRLETILQNLPGFNL